MRIGILTFHDALNAGAVLQAYALQTYLTQQGHQVEFIDFPFPRTFSVRDFVGKSLRSTIEKLMDNYHRISFRTGYNHVLNISSRRYESAQSLTQAPPEYDAYIVGSDQVWNLQRNHPCPSVYLLSFVPVGKRKIAYAASMGQCDVSPSMLRLMRNELSTFSAISLRESDGVKFVQSLSNSEKKIVQTLDPTLLIDPERYLEIAEFPQENNFVASYILNRHEPYYSRVIHHIRQEYKITSVVNLRNPDTCIRLPEAINRVVTPYEWLGHISRSQFVVCGSFHATVFSLIFRKPFVVLEPSAQFGGNLRVRSLLRPLGLEHRCISSYDVDKMNSILATPMEWDSVETRLHCLRKESETFLRQSLED